MGQSLSENMVGTIKQFCEQIRNEMSRPVGVMVYGADSEFKTQIYVQIITMLGSLARYFRATIPTLERMQEAFETKAVIIAALPSEESGNADMRLEFIQRLRDAGAKDVAAIYVRPDYTKVKEPCTRLDVDFSVRNIDSSDPFGITTLDYLFVLRET